jgi:DNA polymerase sigma
MISNISEVYSANMPLLRLQVSSPLRRNSVRVDITIHDIYHNGLACVELVSSIITQLPKLRQVFYALKHLLYFCDLNETYSRGLSSYSLFLMVASYYQM